MEFLEPLASSGDAVKISDQEGESLPGAKTILSETVVLPVCQDENCGVDVDNIRVESF